MEHAGYARKPDIDGHDDSAVASTDSRTINNVNEHLTRTVTGSPQAALVSDHNGDLTNDGNQKYEYDGEIRLIRVLKTDNAVIQGYKYDALGRRVRTIDRSPGVPPEYPSGKSITHVYAGGPECIAEYDTTASQSGPRERWFVHGESFPDPLVMADFTRLGDQAA